MRPLNNPVVKQAAVAMQAAIKSGNDKKLNDAWEQFYDAVTDTLRQDFEMASGDQKVLADRGFRMLTAKENKFYQEWIDSAKSPDPKQAFTDLLNGGMPETIIEDVYKNLVNDHPLLDAITFTNVSYLTKWIMNDHTVQTAVYANVDGVVQESYVKMSKKPADWDKNYANYYVYFSDGLTSEYQGVSGVSKDRYRLQTQQPSDWSVTFSDYFKKVNVYKFFYDEYKKDKSGTWIKVRVVKDSQVQNEITDKHALIFMEKISVGIEYKALEKKAPKWKKNTFYTKVSKQYPPKWKNGYYYRRKEETGAPKFKAGFFYQERSCEVIPSWKPNSYYIERTDHFADLVKNGIEKLKSYYNDEKITTSLDASISYDVGDVIGSREQVTGVQAAQPITKKILKITSDGNTVSYEIGE